MKKIKLIDLLSEQNIPDDVRRQMRNISTKVTPKYVPQYDETITRCFKSDTIKPQPGDSSAKILYDRMTSKLPNGEYSKDIICTTGLLIPPLGLESLKYYKGDDTAETGHKDILPEPPKDEYGRTIGLDGLHYFENYANTQEDLKYNIQRKDFYGCFISDDVDSSDRKHILYYRLPRTPKYGFEDVKIREGMSPEAKGIRNSKAIVNPIIRKTFDNEVSAHLLACKLPIILGIQEATEPTTNIEHSKKMNWGDIDSNFDFSYYSFYNDVSLQEDLKSWADYAGIESNSEAFKDSIQNFDAFMGDDVEDDEEIIEPNVDTEPEVIPEPEEEPITATEPEEEPITATEPETVPTNAKRPKIIMNPEDDDEVGNLNEALHGETQSKFNLSDGWGWSSAKPRQFSSTTWDEGLMGAAENVFKRETGKHIQGFTPKYGLKKQGIERGEAALVTASKLRFIGTDEGDEFTLNLIFDTNVFIRPKDSNYAKKYNSIIEPIQISVSKPKPNGVELLLGSDDKNSREFFTILINEGMEQLKQRILSIDEGQVTAKILSLITPEITLGKSNINENMNKKIALSENQVKRLVKLIKEDDFDSAFTNYKDAKNEEVSMSSNHAKILINIADDWCRSRFDSDECKEIQELKDRLK